MSLLTASRTLAACGLLVACSSTMTGACTGADAESAAGALPAEIDSARAWADLEALVKIGERKATTPGNAAARAYLVQRLKDAGLEPVVERFTADTPASLTMEAGPKEFANVYADLVCPVGEGEDPAPMILLVSHFDTKDLPFEFVGANDSGSSTAFLLELARVLAAAAPRPLTYRFLFVDGEESFRDQWVDPDNRYGSRHHAQKLKDSGEARSRVRCAILFDLIGDADLRLERETQSDQRLLNQFFTSARELGLQDHIASRSIPINDDHISFRDVGIRSIDLIDFDYGPNNAYWHSAEDTLDKCSPESLAILGRIVLHTLPRLEERFGER